MENKRRHDRVKKSIKCEVHSEGMTYSTTIDISNGGVFIATPEPLIEGEEITLYLYIGDGDPVETKARVKWVRSDEDDEMKTGMGVEFLNDQGEKIDVLNQLSK